MRTGLYTFLLYIYIISIYIYYISQFNGIVPHFGPGREGQNRSRAPVTNVPASAYHSRQGRVLFNPAYRLPSPPLTGCPAGQPLFVCVMSGTPGLWRLVILMIKTVGAICRAMYLRVRAYYSWQTRHRVMPRAWFYTLTSVWPSVGVSIENRRIVRSYLLFTLIWVLIGLSSLNVQTPGKLLIELNEPYVRVYTQAVGTMLLLFNNAD